MMLNVLTVASRRCLVFYATHSPHVLIFFPVSPVYCRLLLLLRGLRKSPALCATILVPPLFQVWMLLMTPVNQSRHCVGLDSCMPLGTSLELYASLWLMPPAAPLELYVLLLWLMPPPASSELYDFLLWMTPLAYLEVCSSVTKILIVMMGAADGGRSRLLWVRF